MVSMTMPTGPTFPPTISITQTFNTAFKIAPTLIVGIVEMQWKGNLKYTYHWLNVGLTGAQIVLDTYPTTNYPASQITSIKFNVGVYDVFWYSIQPGTIWEFIYPSTIPANRTLQIPYDNYQLSVLVHYSQEFDPSTLDNYNSKGGFQPDFKFSINPTTQQQFGATYSVDEASSLIFNFLAYLFYNIYTTPNLLGLPTYTINSFVFRKSADVLFIKINQFYFQDQHLFGLSSLTGIANPFSNRQFMANPPSQFFITINYFSSSTSYKQCPFAYPYFNNSDCLVSCPDQTFARVNSYLCQACSNLCLTCSLTFTNCTSCFQGMTLQPNNTCLCSKGMIGMPPFCLPCTLYIAYCLDCTTRNFCDQCDIGMNFDPVSKKCVCPPGTSNFPQNIGSSVINGVLVSYDIAFCVSNSVSETCGDGIITESVSAEESGLLISKQHCYCPGSGVFLNNKCQL